MKTLIILALILGIFTIYFVFNTEKSVSLRSVNDAVPAGTDIVKIALDKALNQIGKIKPMINSVNGINGNGMLQSKLAEGIKLKIKEIGNEFSNNAVNLIKKPIGDKFNQLFCPQG